jgi:hypothetical protein
VPQNMQNREAKDHCSSTLLSGPMINPGLLPEVHSIFPGAPVARLTLDNSSEAWTRFRENLPWVPGSRGAEVLRACLQSVGDLSR